MRGPPPRGFHAEAPLPHDHALGLLHRVWPFVRPQRRYLFAALAIIAAAAGLNLLRPLLMGRVVAAAQAGALPELTRNAMLLVGVFLVIQLLLFIQTYTMNVIGARAMGALRAHIFELLQRVPLRYYDRTPTGRIVTRATNDVDAIGEIFASGALNAVGDIIALGGILAMMVMLDTRLSLVAFAAMPPVGLFVWLARARARGSLREIRVGTARLNSFLNEQIAGVSVVQAYAREEAMTREFDAIHVGYRAANKQSTVYDAVTDATIELVGTMCIASILWFAGRARFTDVPVTFALVVTFTQYIKNHFFDPISLLASRYTILQSAGSGAERVFQLIDEVAIRSTPPSATSPLPPGATDEVLSLERLSFAYEPGFPVLRDVSLEVKRGEKVAIVGTTGAGKTTLTSLLLRLYDVETGRCRVFGRDVQSYAPSELRQLFAVVPQEVLLFPGTIASNVAMTTGAPDRARVEDALKSIGALEMFMAREGGLEAEVDERGANLSTGERQLIAFARALYRDAPVLLLDEATASIDPATEARMHTALEAVVKDRTCVVIAHRLSTLRSVDRVIVMQRGRIVECGTQEELIALGGVYARLYRLQFAVEQRERLARADEAAPG
jgi:ATP-binding cassette subfamily B protein